MYDHVGLKVKDMAASVRFYKAALASLGHVLGAHGDGYAGFGPKDAPGFWLHAHKGATGPGAHVAFRAPNRAAKVSPRDFRKAARGDRKIFQERLAAAV